jgi:SulP family sulfate permease
LLTVVFDLTVAVQVGIVLACALFIRRMSGLFSVELETLQPPVLTYRIYGALFFGAAAKLDEAVNAAERAPRGMTVVLDATHLIYLDATGVDALRQLHRAVLARDGVLRDGVAAAAAARSDRALGLCGGAGGGAAGVTARRACRRPSWLR